MVFWSRFLDGGVLATSALTIQLDMDQIAILR